MTFTVQITLSSFLSLGKQVNECSTREDVAMLVEWGVDYLKYDNCFPRMVSPCPFQSYQPPPWKQPYSHALGINWGTQWLKKSSTGRQHQRWGGVYWLCSLCGALPKYLAGFNNFHCFPWYIRSTRWKISGSNFSLHTSRAIVMQDPSEEVLYSVMGQALADVRKVLCL